MGDIEKLSQASTSLANHVAAVVRMSNVLSAILTDGDRDDIDQETRRVILRAAKDEHESFRTEHFRGMIADVNTVIGIVDALYRAEVPAKEPIDPDEQEEPDKQEEPDDAPAAS